MIADLGLLQLRGAVILPALTPACFLYSAAACQDKGASSKTTPPTDILTSERGGERETGRITPQELSVMRLCLKDLRGVSIALTIAHVDTRPSQAGGQPPLDISTVMV